MPNLCGVWALRPSPWHCGVQKRLWARRSRACSRVRACSWSRTSMALALLYRLSGVEYVLVHTTSSYRSLLVHSALGCARPGSGASAGRPPGVSPLRRPARAPPPPGCPCREPPAGGVQHYEYVLASSGPVSPTNTTLPFTVPYTNAGVFTPTRKRAPLLQLSSWFDDRWTRSCWQSMVR